MKVEKVKFDCYFNHWNVGSILPMLRSLGLFQRDVETDQHDSINEDDSIDQAKTKENRVLKSTGYTNIDENVAEELATSSNDHFLDLGF